MKEQLTTNGRVDVARWFIESRGVKDEDLQQDIYLVAIENPDVKLETLQTLFESKLTKHYEQKTMTCSVPMNWSEKAIDCFLQHKSILKVVDQAIISKDMAMIISILNAL